MIGDKPDVFAVKVWAYREHVDQTVDFWGVSTKSFGDAEQRAWERMNNFDPGATKHFDNGVSEQIVLKEGEWVERAEDSVKNSNRGDNGGE